MKLVDLLKELKLRISNQVDIEILNVTNDSRKCNENSLYINTNHQYLNLAVANGVRVIISDVYAFHDDLIVIYVNDIKQFYYAALKVFYHIDHGYKIGITGTSGKTTTATLLYESLKHGGYDTLLISSNGNFIYYNQDEEFFSTENTTPNIEIIYELINKYKYDYVIIEVSSQGLMNNRLFGLEFDLAVFLNLSNEHLDYHHNLEEYLEAKMQLFKMLKPSGIGLINNHSDYKERFYKLGKVIYTFGINQGDFQIDYEKVDLETMKINLTDKWISTALTGEYNAENISCVNAILKLINVSNVYLEECLTSNFKIPGRFEIIHFKMNKIIIDFAHTEKEVERLLKHIKEYSIGKLYIVIGCGGNRDKTKRPVIGKLSTFYGDFVIFTEDNNRNEKPIEIINDMICEIDKTNYVIIFNRFDAIKMGISLLKNDDILVIVGKGIDKTLVFDKELNDFEMVEEVLKNEY